MTDQNKIPIHIINPKDPGVKELGADKLARNTARFDQDAPVLRKPSWIRVRLPAGNAVADLKSRLRDNSLVTVCEEATCPNIHECFNKGTATFMILGEICTRRCSFCDVAHGRPNPPDENEPESLAQTIHDMKLRYVVITSVDRDDLRDGGAEHYVRCLSRIRELSPGIKLEILVPDFRGKGRLERALEILKTSPPDVFNHNLETVPGLYPEVRPGARYFHSLRLLQRVKELDPTMFTKSGIMVGLGEDRQGVLQVMDDMRAADIDFLTIGQYLQPTPKHHGVDRYVTPDEFKSYERTAFAKGFLMVSATPLTRSSYHAGDDFQRLRAARLAKLAD